MSYIESPTEALVDALTAISGQLTATLYHMHLHANPHGPPVIEVLSNLLAEVIDTELDHAPDDLYSAAAIINATSQAVEDNILLVNPDAPVDDELP
jgi:hypothetical protein